MNKNARFCHHCIISLQFAVYREKINELDHALQSSTEQTVQSDAEALEVVPYYHEDIRGLITVVCVQAILMSQYKSFIDLSSKVHQIHEVLVSRPFSSHDDII